MTVGQRIKQKRLELGLTQLELAEKMGYSGKTSVSAAENCGDNITTSKVRKFADALGVSFYYLMGYEEEESTDPTTNDTEQAKVIREIYKNFSPEVLDDPKTMAQIMEFIKIFLSLSPDVRTAFLQTLRGLKS